MNSAIVGNKSMLPRSANRSKDKTFDKIWKYYYLTDKKVELTPKQEQIRERWERAWLMDSSLLSKFRIARLLAKKYGITERQGFKDIKNARLLFSDPTQQNKEAQRAIMSNILEKTIRKAYIAREFKAVDKLILRYSAINGLTVEKDNAMEEFLKKQKPVAIIFGTDPQLLEQQAAELVQDVEHEEID